ncbi:MAG: NAD-dependent epimerase/dehydratase family protein [Flavobacteriia bacterium]|nr:NAD-dependent epimerase/dehydratase family protein [Flavobacteriia bacterium]
MILVTGGTGLVGSHLLFHLAEMGVSVRASYRSADRKAHVLQIFSIYSTSAEQLFSSIEWVNADLIDPSCTETLLAGIDEVFHCAAQVSFHADDKQRLLTDNPLMTRYLVNEALAQNVKAFHHMSSVATLGWPPEEQKDKLLDESSVWKDDPDQSVYAQSKYLAELEVWRAREEGLNASIVNPGIILGPGFGDEGSSSIFGLVRRGFSFFTAGANGFVDVRDVVAALLTLSNSTEAPHKGRFILIAENMAYKELFTLIARSMDLPPPHRAARPWMIHAIRIAHWLREKTGGRKATITRETAASAQRISRYSNQRSVDALSLNYRSVEETVEFICRHLG